MPKLIVLVGDGGSGKTTLIAELTKKYPDRFRRLVTCTSRQPRVGEVDGIDYHFCPTSYFINNNELVLDKLTARGDYYGTRFSDLAPAEQHALLTLRYKGVERLARLGLENVLVVHISVSEELKVARMRQRGDTEEMISSRLVFDGSDRKEINWSRFPVIDLEAADPLADKVARVAAACG